MSTDKTLPPCAVCQANVAIYRCPRCHVYTCSLKCCRTHKSDAKCDGKRDRTQFCSVKGFTDSQLSSDYHFLEDVLKVSESTKRLYHGIVAGDNASSAASSASTKRARGNKINVQNLGKLDLDSISSKPPAHPLLRAKEGKSMVNVLAHGVDDMEMEKDETQLAHQSNGIINELLANKPDAKPMQSKRENVSPLVRQAELKGVNLLRMPIGMERRRSNTTKFSKKKGIIWKVELCFHHTKDTSDGGGDESRSSKEKPVLPKLFKVESKVPKVLKVESKVSDSSTLYEELGKHLDVHPGNSTTRSSLRAFATVPRGSLVLFMKRLPCSSAAPQYYKLDPNTALVDSLKGKTLIEFPTIDVALESDKDNFPLFIDEIQ